MDITRREFIKWATLTGATIALAGCATPPHQALVSQLELPEYRLPGEAKWFATACQECQAGCGVAVRVIDGRAKKLEGIPEHPLNHGKLCARAHSSLQALYNPDRLTAIQAAIPKSSGGVMAELHDWNVVAKVLGSLLKDASLRKGSMLWITGSLRGTTGALMVSLAEKVGAKIWVLDFPGTTPQRVAMKSLTGKAELPYYPIEDADYIVNFGNDFLLTGNLPVHDAWQYGEFRQGKDRARRGTLVSFSPRMNLSDANSDKWIAVRPGTEGWVALGLGNVVAQGGKKGWPEWASRIPLETVSKMTGIPGEIFERLGKRLLQSTRPLALAGIENGSHSNGVWTIWMVQALNRLLGNPIQSFEPNLLTGVNKISPNLFLSTRDAVTHMQRGDFSTVWVLDANPRYLLPAKLNFEQGFTKIKNKVVFSPFPTETTLLADLVLPTQTWYETWGDRLIRGRFGSKKTSSTVYNLQQPVVQGRPGTQAIADILIRASEEAGGSIRMGPNGATAHDLLRSHFKNEGEWENLLIRGGAWESHSLDWELYQGENRRPLYPPPPLKRIAKAPGGISPWEHLKKIAMSAPMEPRLSGKGQALIPFVSPSLGDGSLANRPWMQELSDPLTTVVWTHWVELPISLSKKLGVERGDVVRISSESGSLTGPAYPNLALHEEAVAVPVGQGHNHYGQFADRGENPLSILDPVWQEETGEPAWVGTRVQVEKVGTKARMTVLDERVDKYPKEFMPL